MKTRVSLLLVCLLWVATGSFAKERRIKGDGNVVKKEIAIKNYDHILLVGSVDFEYEQSSASPYLRVEVDANILPYLVVKVEGSTLKVYPKSLSGDEDGHGPCYNFDPTVFKIKSNSPNLREAEVVGSAGLTVVSPLKVDRIEVSLAGSGSVNFDKALTGNKGEFSVAGSGSVNARDIALDNLDCSVAGSGEITLKGALPRATFGVAGSGEINAFDCKVKNLECNVAGSGSVEAYAVDNLDASVVSSGEIMYKGAPTVNKSVMGSGSVRKVN